MQIESKNRAPHAAASTRLPKWQFADWTVGLSARTVWFGGLGTEMVCRAETWFYRIPRMTEWQAWLFLPQALWFLTCLTGLKWWFSTCFCEYSGTRDNGIVVFRHGHGRIMTRICLLGPAINDNCQPSLSSIIIDHHYHASSWIIHISQWVILCHGEHLKWPLAINENYKPSITPSNNG